MHLGLCGVVVLWYKRDAVVPKITTGQLCASHAHLSFQYFLDCGKKWAIMTNCNVLWCTTWSNNIPEKFLGSFPVIEIKIRIDNECKVGSCTLRTPEQNFAGMNTYLLRSNFWTPSDCLSRNLWCSWSCKSWLHDSQLCLVLRGLDITQLSLIYPFN